MHEPGLSFETLLRYEEQEAQRWEKFFHEHPQALELPVDIAETSTVREFLVHIFGVEHRNAERLLGEAHTSNEKFDRGSIPAIFDIGRNARTKLRQYLASANAGDFERPRDFPSMTAGKIWASPQKLAAHALIHGIRHWAQLASALRRQGYPQDWFHDILYLEPWNK
jgi:uncharacterized damage-inducible protein DinB